MDNILKKTIREEIEKYEQQKKPTEKPSPQKKPPQKKPHQKKTEKRLSNLLEKINNNNSSASGSGGATTSSKLRKTKKLQFKYERFDPISKLFKLLRQKDGGGPRFIDVLFEETILFKEIFSKVEKLCFDNNSCHYFCEKLSECRISLTDV